MIPAGWKSVTAGQLASERTGSVDPAKFPDEIFDLYSIPSYDTGEPEVLAGREIGSSKKVVKEGDILISKIVPHIRRVWIVGPNRGRRQIASGEWISFSDEGIYPNYLRYFLLSDGFHTKFMSTITGVGGSLLRARPSEVNKIAVPLPPLATQKHIARVLEQADQLRKQAQQMESELKLLAQSLFLEMFGDPVTNPRRWATIPYANLCHRITVGIVVKPSDYYVDYGVPALRSLNIRENKIIKENFVYFSEANNVGPLQKTRVYKDDVVLVRSGQPGTAAVVPEELDGVNAIDILISTPIKEKVVSSYLSFFFNSSGGKKIVGAAERGQIQKHLNVGSLESALIPVPPLSLQEEFVRQLDAIANVRRNAEANMESINMTFESLMQRAFNGELTAPEREAA